MLYTDSNCKSNQFKATLIKEKVYSNAYLKWPDDIPSYNFRDTW